MKSSITDFQIKPANILSLKIEVDDSGYYSELDPQPDITPYETMLIFKLVTVMLNTTDRKSTRLNSSH